MRTLALALLLCGCAPVYYAPAAHVPLLAARGDAHAGFYTGTNGYDAQVAYAVASHVGVAATGSYYDGDTHRHGYGDLALGAFTTLGAYGSAELWAGGGYGRSRGEGKLDETTFTGQGDYLRAFAQADVALRTRLIDLGVMARLAHLRYAFTEIDREPTAEVQQQLVLEPIAFARAGWDIVKLELQLGLVLATRGDAPNVIPFPIHVSLGVHVDLSRLTRVVAAP